MEKKIISLVLAALLLLGMVFVSAAIFEDKAEVEEEAPVPVCGPNTCSFECGGQCGTQTCGCRR